MRNRYPFVQHLLCILPLFTVLACVTLFIGTGDEVVQFFRQVRGGNPNLTRFMKVVTDWGNPALYIVYAGILYAGRRNGDARLTRFVITWLVIQLLVSFLLVRVFKIVIGRPRPGVDGLYAPWSLSGGYNSMPSGHTAEITGNTVPLAFFSRHAVMPLLLGGYGALVGFSRVYLEMHHTSDVFFGILVGSFAAFLIHLFWNRDRDDR